MNGHRNLWFENGLPTTLDEPRIEPADYPVRDVEESECRIGRDGVLAGLDNPDRVLLDMRTPEEYYGEFVGDLAQRRAQIVSTDTHLATTTIIAHAPLAELFGYSSAMRSLSQGRAGSSMEPLEYAPAPSSVANDFAM